MLLEIGDLIERTAAWLLYRRRLEIGPDIETFGPSVRKLAASLFELLPPRDRSVVDERRLRLTKAGVPEALAARIGGTMFLASPLHIPHLPDRPTQPPHPPPDASSASA